MINKNGLDKDISVKIFDRSENVSRSPQCYDLWREKI